MILINNELIKDNTRHRFAILSKLDIVNNILISHHDISKSQEQKTKVGHKSLLWVGPSLGTPNNRPVSPLPL